MKNKGFSAIIIILAVFVLIALALGAYYLKTQGYDFSGTNKTESTMMYKDTEATPSAEPVSDSTDSDTLQKELDETDPGSIDTDIDVMLKDTSSL